MGNPDGTGKGSLENLIDGIWPRVLSRGMSIIGWPLMGFVAWQLWSTGVEMVTSQREMAFSIREIRKDIDSHDKRIDRLERPRRSGLRPSQPAEETP